MGDLFVKSVWWDGWRGQQGFSFDEFRSGVKFTRLACVEIREAYLSKESTETMQIEEGLVVSGGEGGTMCPSGPEREGGAGVGWEGAEEEEEEEIKKGGGEGESSSKVERGKRGRTEGEKGRC